jgi:predicted DNA-binding transcriptional regulator AlpA
VQKDDVKFPLMVNMRWWRDQVGISRQFIWRKVAAGEFPPPDCKVGRELKWKGSTARAWYERVAG